MLKVVKVLLLFLIFGEVVMKIASKRFLSLRGQGIWRCVLPGME